MLPHPKTTAVKFKIAQNSTQKLQKQEKTSNYFSTDAFQIAILDVINPYSSTNLAILMC